MSRSSKPDHLKNPRRVMAGKMVYGRRKAAQDAADKVFLDRVAMIALGVVSVLAALFVLYLLATVKR